MQRARSHFSAHVGACLLVFPSNVARDTDLNSSLHCHRVDYNALTGSGHDTTYVVLGAGNLLVQCLLDL
jgi:hypothetical protein